MGHGKSAYSAYQDDGTQIADTSTTNIDEDVNINRGEIKQTLESVGEESLGDVGIAMENAIENLEDEKEN